MPTAQVEFTEDELLMDVAIAAPLFAGGLRCHGGFDAEGRYVSPRTRFRRPAIEAWAEQNCETFSTELLDVPMERWERTFPNVAQARLLITAGVPEPLIATLTRIGTVEGYGANIQRLKPANLQRHFDEDITGTAIDHLGRGLFEAHGRDEAGWGGMAGHKDMWFAARDLAFGAPTSEIDVEGMLERMGFSSGGPPPSQVRRLSEDIPVELETMVSLMLRVLFIEISAFHTFAWAEAWLSDPELVEHADEASRLVGYIRLDESPHVDYLRTALSELRDRTWIGESGRRYDGAEVVGTLWDALLDLSLGQGRAESRRAALGEVEYWCAKRSDGTDLLAEFHALGAT